jgi:hypothetical protein
MHEFCQTSNEIQFLNKESDKVIGFIKDKTMGEHHSKTCPQIKKYRKLAI